MKISEPFFFPIKVVPEQKKSGSVNKEGVEEGIKREEYYFLKLFKSVITTIKKKNYSSKEELPNF